VSRGVSKNGPLALPFALCCSSVTTEAAWGEAMRHRVEGQKGTRNRSPFFRIEKRGPVTNAPYVVCCVAKNYKYFTPMLFNEENNRSPTVRLCKDRKVSCAKSAKRKQNHQKTYHNSTCPGRTSLALCLYIPLMFDLWYFWILVGKILKILMLEYNPVISSELMIQQTQQTKHSVGPP